MKISKEDLTELFARYVDASIARKAAYSMVSRKHNIKRTELVLEGYMFKIHLLSGNRKYVSVSQYHQASERIRAAAMIRRKEAKIAEFKDIIRRLYDNAPMKSYNNFPGKYISCCRYKLFLDRIIHESKQVEDELKMIMDSYGYSDQPTFTEEQEIALWKQKEAVPLKTRLKMDRSPTYA